MSQRNPMNERYQSEEHTGVREKSAASAKPKAKAAASVIVQSSEKTPQQKKAERKAEKRKLRDEQRELDRKYYNPDTKRHKNLRRGWWACLIGAILCTVASFFGRGFFPDWFSLVTLFLAYGLIIMAFYIDFSKIRRERRNYQERMIALEEKQKKVERAAARNSSSVRPRRGRARTRPAIRRPRRKPPRRMPRKLWKEEAAEKEARRRGCSAAGSCLSNREKMREEKAWAKAEKQAEKAQKEAEKADAAKAGE